MKSNALKLPRWRPMRRLFAGCAVVLFATGSAVAEVRDSPLSPGELGSLGEHRSLALSDCNRAISLHVTGAQLRETVNGEPPADGEQWLVLDLRFDNWMPADLLFGLGYQEAILIASLERQLYLLINDRRVARPILPLDSELSDEFILPHVGANAAGQVAYPVPTDTLESLSLRYYHDEYAPLAIALTDHEALADADGDPEQAAENDLMRITLHGATLHHEWRGEPAPAGMQWLVADVRGQSLWRIGADARALDESVPLEASAEVPKVMEYMEASGLLQLVVDGRHGYPRHVGLGNLPADPPWLPDADAGGIAVFPVPKTAEHVELVAYFPHYRATDIPTRDRKPMRFPLDVAGGPGEHGAGMDSPETLLEIPDEPTPLRVHDVRIIDRFADHKAGEDEALLLLTASMRNLGDAGGMMPVSHRLTLVDGNDARLDPVTVYQPGPIELTEPFWLPPGGEERRFTALYRVAEGAAGFSLDYTGVSHSERVSLPMPDR